MKESTTLSTQITISPDAVDENTTVILGFTGFGSVGTTTVNHITESCNVDSIGFWGNSAWYHKDRLESPITIYRLNLKSKDPKEKFVLVSSRISIPVVGYSALPDAFWKLLTQEIFSWKAKRYIVIGGLREEVRSPSDNSWVALIPSPKYKEIYGTKRTFHDHLAIKGPIGFLLMEGTAYNSPVLAILSYCNTFDIDIDAAQIALKELEKHLHIKLKSDTVTLFDSSFIEPDSSVFWIEEESEDSYDDYEDDMDYEDYEDEDADADFRGGKTNRENRQSDGINFKTYKDFHDKGENLDEYK